MSSVVRVQHVEQTTDFCPTQWEGYLDDGRMFYVRYRWGWLSMRVSAERTDNLDDAIDGEEIVGIQHGQRFDGCMSFDTLRELTLRRVEWPTGPTIKQTNASRN